MDTRGDRFIQKVAPLSVLNIILAILTTSLNIVRGLWGLQTIPYGTQALLINLSVADLITSLCNQTVYVSFLILQLHRITVCSVSKTSEIITNVVWFSSFLTVLACSFECYVSIFHPFFHEKLTEGPKLKFIMTGI